MSNTITAEVQKEFLLPQKGFYLNCANMSPLLVSVEMAGQNALARRGSPWSILGKDWFEDAEVLRNLAAGLFDAADDDIAFVPSVSYGMALAAKNIKLGPGKKIIVLEEQYPSNFYVWREMADAQKLELVTVKREPGLSITESLLKSIDNSTGLVAIPNCHWMDGAWVDLSLISSAVRDVNAFFVLDLSQSLGALPISMKAINPDFAVSVGYKWQLGPYGLGYLYVAPHFHSGQPLEYSWLTRAGAEDFTKLSQYNVDFKTGARRFDMGEYSQFQLMPMAIAALRQVTTWGVNNIQTAVQKLTAPISEFKRASGLVDYEIPHVGHMIGVPLEKLDAGAVKRNLQEKGIVVSYRGNSIRVAPHIYNTAKEITAFLECLEK